ncbi:hypothetical protein M8542_27120 [Amycolatopsis sp. OK19-0408]|uniref:Uncharacterized protein n=1 Tax=Amycolatopsis iheyensis TaxID=2945988 RepID=A0A9X2SNI9_9PSEU|nr:hypothetical protein [Amycolatopsis iheyensis]MCR6486505.1 hypothetical protein [Amycolatopsis iheyensis]
MLEAWGTVPAGEVVASTVDAFGRVIALYADGGLLVDGTSCGRVAEPGRHPMIDASGDGFVLANSRCRIRPGAEAPRNGRILDGAGQVVTAFHAGDGIEEVVTGPTGEIWISYFDEASILDGGLRSHPGLIRWTAAGEPAWRVRHDPGLYWMDCYALNVGERRTWAVPYPEVPLVEVGADGLRSVRASPVRSVLGVAVSGADALFLLHHGGEFSTRTARLRDDEVVADDPRPLVAPGGWTGRRVSRGDRMWLQFGDTWYVLGL